MVLYLFNKGERSSDSDRVQDPTVLSQIEIMSAISRSGDVLVRKKLMLYWLR